MTPRSLAISFVPIFMIAIAACGGTTSEVQTDPKIDQYQIVQIAVLPFSVEPPSIGQERGYAAPAPPVSAAETVRDIFYRKLKNRDGISVIPSYVVQDAMPTGSGTPLTMAQIKSIGEKLGAGAVLVGKVGVYKERAGSKIGLDRPQDAAEVGFVVELIRVKDGIPVWTGQYYEHQRPANQDLSGLLERGPRYLTVEQLAESAADHVLRKFPLGTPSQQPERSTSAGQ
jgi:hypothetical protein